MAAASSTPPIPISHAINSDDEGLKVIVIAAVLLVSSTLTFMLRLWVRWPWKALFEYDDICTAVAHVWHTLRRA